MSELCEVALRARTCPNCPLYRRATQTVFGSGPVSAPVMLVGEQPGDREDLEGHPFVGPAGALLDTTIADAGLSRAEVYLTNAVKHFKWEEKGTRRLHKKPSRSEVLACRPWLEAELSIVQPRVVVARGHTAGSSLCGPSFRVRALRRAAHQVVVGPWAGALVATFHPSAALRARDTTTRAELTNGLRHDLELARELVSES